MSRHPARSSPALISLLLSLAAGAGSATAATVKVTVTGQDGQPARDVVVWVTPPGRLPPPMPTTTPVVIEQRDLQFVPPVTVVRTGTLVRFDNKDAYDHHVRSVPSGPLGGVPPAKVFELRLSGVAGPTHTADIVADKVGIVGLGCHLHSSMRGHLFVADTPYFAKTDAAGVATLDGLPDGPQEVRLWHPGQLVDQPGHVVQGGAGAVSLNFSPRRRRGG